MNGKSKVKIFVMVCAIGLAGCSRELQHNLMSGGTSSAAKGEEVMRAQCLVCHGTDLIEQQRLAKAGWTREVEKMVRWGANVSDAEKEPLIEYLTSRFGPRPHAAAASSQPQPTPEAKSVARGAAIFKAKCLICHQADLIEQQRLARAGWVREVEKMTRWGADVSDAEKEPLVDYLFSHYGPNRKLAGGK